MATRKDYRLGLFHGTLLVGLGVLAFTHYWWPGIMFVMGGAMLASGLAKRGAWRDFTTAFVLLAIGALFQADAIVGGNVVGFWPIVLIVLGLVLILSKCS